MRRRQLWALVLCRQSRHWTVNTKENLSCFSGWWSLHRTNTKKKTVANKFAEELNGWPVGVYRKLWERRHQEGEQLVNSVLLRMTSPNLTVGKCTVCLVHLFAQQYPSSTWTFPSVQFQTSCKCYTCLSSPTGSPAVFWNSESSSHFSFFIFLARGSIPGGILGLDQWKSEQDMCAAMTGPACVDFLSSYTPLCKGRMAEEWMFILLSGVVLGSLSRFMFKNSEETGGRERFIVREVHRARPLYVVHVSAVLSLTLCSHGWIRPMCRIHLGRPFALWCRADGCSCVSSVQDC